MSIQHLGDEQEADILRVGSKFIKIKIFIIVWLYLLI